ncbi:helix-turn-helix domain-containing protein [Streptomyces sp. NPDC004082]|uniref:helix-turn-helix domain-containing protein n=1 Tax=unclassified Streptomyces TaxID=2593676 RepID=UPI00339DBD2B
MEHPPADALLAALGPRLRRLRVRRGMTLAGLAEGTGISRSTLSRLETGGRRPDLELLLPLARFHRVPLDELVGTREPAEPLTALDPRRVGRRTALPLTSRPGAPAAWKVIIPMTLNEPDLRVHAGHVWLHVLSGRLRLVLGSEDLVLASGETAHFDTRMPHWFGSTGLRPVELLSLSGHRDEHVRERAGRR